MQILAEEGLTTFINSDRCDQLLFLVCDDFCLLKMSMVFLVSWWKYEYSLLHRLGFKVISKCIVTVLRACSVRFMYLHQSVNLSFAVQLLISVRDCLLELW